MKICILNLIVSVILALPVAAERNPSILKKWKFGEGTLELYTMPANHGGQLGLAWSAGGGIKSSYVGIEDLAKLIRVMGQLKVWNSIEGRELKIHWDNDILVTFREKEVVFKFDSIGSFTVTWDEALNIVKAIENGRKKLNEEAGGITPLDAKLKDSELDSAGQPATPSLSK